MLFYLENHQYQMVFDVSNKDLSSTKLNPFEGYFVENRFATRIKVPTI